MADKKRVVESNLAAMTEEDVEIAETLWAEQVKERAHLDAECTEDKVEQEAAWGQEAMSMVHNTTAEMIRICAICTCWGNTDIKER